MSVGYCSDAGKKREENQDSICALPEYGLYAVADGMGGHDNGKYASNLALDTLMEEIKEQKLSNFALEQLEKLFIKVNDKVYQMQQKIQCTMGTTLSAIVLDKECFRLGHIGDSRVYLYREKHFEQLTNDHSYFAEAQKYTILNEKFLQQKQKKNVLTRAIGPEQEIHGQYLTKELYKDDLILICSDGLYKEITDTEIANVLEQDSDVQNMCNTLLQTALKNGGNDNISVLIYRHDGK